MRLAHNSMFPVGSRGVLWHSTSPPLAPLSLCLSSRGTLSQPVSTLFKIVHSLWEGHPEAPPDRTVGHEVKRCEYKLGLLIHCLSSISALRSTSSPIYIFSTYNMSRQLNVHLADNRRSLARISRPLGYTTVPISCIFRTISPRLANAFPSLKS